MPSFARELEQTLHNALAEAANRKHEYATLEHLLLALTDDDHAAQVMTACGVEISELQEAVGVYLDNELEALRIEGTTDPSPTSGFQRVVQRAILHVQSSGRDEVTVANVLVALFSERESYAVYFLQQQDMSRLDAVSYISHGIGKGGRQIESKQPSGSEDAAGDAGEATKEGNKKETALDQFTVNLNAKAEAGKLEANLKAAVATQGLDPSTSGLSHGLPRWPVLLLRGRGIAQRSRDRVASRRTTRWTISARSSSRRSHASPPPSRPRRHADVARTHALCTALRTERRLEAAGG